ncbi:unnamed protein product [Fusarium graminearum]|uniref:Ecp2 effector protein domain-containing protein n=1 Tax=Gibberella zeae TaxID=5518 RepID=A0A9N8RML8_GIBZA|nr:unnamed protein product [Fusarium graminearum]
MHPFLWLPIYALLCVACDVSNGHSVLTSRVEQTTVQEVTLSLTDSTAEEFERPTRWPDPDEPLCICQTHSDLPYSPDGTTASATTASGDKITGLSPTEETADGTADGPTDIDSGSGTSHPTSVEHTSYLETYAITKTNGKEQSSDATKTLLDGASASETESKENDGSVTTTDTNQPPPTTTLIRSKTMPSEEAVSDHKVDPEKGEIQQWPVCNDGNTGSSRAVASRMASAKSFCDQFREAPLTLEGWHKTSSESGTVFGVNFSKYSSQRCSGYKVDDVVCWQHLAKVERLCGKFGGFVIGDCVLVWADSNLDTAV